MKSAKGSLLFRDVLRNMRGNEFIFSHRRRIRWETYCPFVLYLQRRLGSCHPVKKLLYSCLARRVSAMPLLLCPGTLVAWLTLIGAFLFPARPCLPACRMVWRLSAVRSAAAGAPPASLGSSSCSEGSAGAAGCWHTSGLNVKLMDTTWIFGDAARRKNRRLVR